MTNMRHLFVYLLVALSAKLAAAGDSTNECVYTIYVKTGQGIKVGTDSKISLTIGDADHRSTEVPNLKAWGLMGPTHDYFERDNLDIFSGRGACMGAPICRLNLTSDGSGSHHGWYCEYVEVTSTGPHQDCSKTMFYVNQWLATDAPPYQLTAVIEGCKLRNTPTKHGSKTNAFVVGNIKGSTFE